MPIRTPNEDTLSNETGSLGGIELPGPENVQEEAGWDIPGVSFQTYSPRLLPGKNEKTLPLSG